MDKQVHDALYRATIDHALDAIVTIDDKGVILEFNPGAERAFGYKRQNVVGHLLEDVLIPESLRSAHREGLERYLRTGEHNVLFQRIEISALHADGREIPVELAITPVTVEGETFFTAYLRDISDAKQARAEIDSIARFPSEDPDPVLRLGPDGEVLYANDAACVVASLFADTTQARVSDSLAVVGTNAHATNNRSEIDHSAGSEIYSLEFVPVPGQPYVNVYGRSVTAYRRAIEMLRSSEHQLRLITENIPYLVVHVDADLRLLFCNEQFGEWFQRVPQDVIGLRLDEILSAEHFEMVHRELEAVLTGETLTCDSLVKYPDGVTRHALRYYVPDRSADGRVVGCYVFVQDITESKRAEQSILEAKAQAERSDEAKSELLATVSHEIRTPLHGLLGMLEMLSQSTLSSEQYELARSAGRSGHALLAVLNDILDISQIEAGRLELSREYFELRPLVEECVETARSYIRGKPIAVRCDVDTVTPTAFIGDPGRLRQVLLNLLTNAVKFTDRGSVSLTVAATDETPECVQLRFAVADTGIGIPAEAIEDVFKEFKQVDVGMRSEQRGTGLGLTISRRLARLMGGDICVESTIGQGSTFTFELRLDRVQEPAAQVSFAAEDSASGWNRGHHEPSFGAQVLVVDDSPTNQRVAKLFLESDGHVVATAANGAEAISCVLGRAFDLVLMDVSMPEMDGLEAARRLREAGATVPIVAMTAQAVAGDRDRCRAAGMDDYLAKPVRRNELLEVVRKWVPEDDGARNRDVETAVVAGRSEAIDGDVLERLRLDVGDEAFDEVVTSFMNEIGQLVGALASDAWDCSDQRFAELGRKAHTLKSCSAGIGAHGLVGSAGALEAACRDRRNDECQRLSQTLPSLLNEVRRSLRAMALQV